MSDNAYAVFIVIPYLCIAGEKQHAFCLSLTNEHPVERISMNSSVEMRQVFNMRRPYRQIRITGQFTILQKIG